MNFFWAAVPLLLWGCASPPAHSAYCENAKIWAELMQAQGAASDDVQFLYYRDGVCSGTLNQGEKK